MKTIAIDFDGVIHQYTGWNEGKLSGPIEYAKECIQQIQKGGVKVVIFSTREVSVIKQWLLDYGFPNLEVTNTKPLCHVILDDRVIRFDGVWSDDLINDLVNFEPYWKEKKDA